MKKLNIYNYLLLSYTSNIEVDCMENRNLNEEILNLKKVNNRNSGIIIVLLAILLFVCLVAVYVKYFS